MHVLRGHSGYVRGVVVTADGRRAVSGSDDHTLRVWDLEAGTILRVLEGHTDRVLSLIVTPDGGRAVSGDRHGTLRMWDLESGRCLAVYPGWAWVTSIALGTQGRIVGVGTYIGDVIFLAVQGIEFGPDLKLVVPPDPSLEGYEQLLRRGLEFTRRVKGNDHEESLAHLSALVVHLEKMGKAGEVAQFAQDRDHLASRLAAKKGADKK